MLNCWNFNNFRCSAHTYPSSRPLPGDRRRNNLSDISYWLNPCDQVANSLFRIMYGRGRVLGRRMSLEFKRIVGTMFDHLGWLVVSYSTFTLSIYTFFFFFFYQKQLSQLRLLQLVAWVPFLDVRMMILCRLKYSRSISLLSCLWTLQVSFFRKNFWNNWKIWKIR